MKPDFQEFIFDSYLFDRQTKRLELHYKIDDAYSFTETYTFDFPFADYSEQALDRAAQNLFFVAGVSYYKTFLPPTISVQAGQIDRQLADFLERTYQKGLGEFFYVNKLDPTTPILFPVTTESSLNTLSFESAGQVIGIGGGKDSLVSVEVLRNQPKVATWSLGHQPQLSHLVDKIGLVHFWVEREWDKQLLGINQTPGAMNGHIPISAIFACVGTIVCILSGQRDNVVSNENSANEETLQYQGVGINHQYSKTSEFEASYQTLLKHCFDDSLRYYSLLRPYSELRITELFVPHLDKYQGVFSSCNRAFRHGENHMFWCGECPKCAFTYLALSPFVEPMKLHVLFGGKDLLRDPKLEQTYRNLLGINGEKPLDCVGEVKESRAAMRLAQHKYPELAKYRFELPADYDFRARAEHMVPPEIATLLP